MIIRQYWGSQVTSKNVDQVKRESSSTYTVPSYVYQSYHFNLYLSLTVFSDLFRIRYAYVRTYVVVADIAVTTPS